MKKPIKKIDYEDSGSESDASVSGYETASEAGESEEERDIEEIKKQETEEAKRAEKKEREKEKEKLKRNSTKKIEKKRKKTTVKKHSVDRKRKISEIFDESDICLDLSTQKIKIQKIKISNNLLLESKYITVPPDEEGNSKTYEYPAIVFVRKMKNNKMFDFNIPFSLGKKVQDGLNVLMAEN